MTADRSEKAAIKGGIKRKIIVSVCSRILLLIFVGVFLGYLGAFILMRDSVGRDRENMAAILSFGITEMIDKRIDSLRGYANDAIWVNAADAKNLMYKDMSDESISRYFSNMDAKWAAAFTDSLLVKDYLDNQAGRELLEVVRKDGTIAEIFITDAHGGLVASSNKTSDFYQADEEWWQKAYNEGKGNVFISDIEFDESSNTMSLAFAMPIKKDNAVVGICKAVVDVGLFINPLKKFKLGMTGNASLLNKKGKVLFHDKMKPQEAGLESGQGLELAHDVKNKWAIINSRVENKLVFVSWNIVTHPILFKEGISWVVVISQDLQEVFRPLYILIFQGIVLSILLVILMIPIGYTVGEEIVRPIIALQDAVRRIAAGALGYKIDLKTGDEIEDLADAFNKMTSDLEKTMVSRESLVKEVAERARAEKIALEAKRIWEDSFDTISDIITIHDKDFNIIQANKAAEAGLGLPIYEILKQKCFRSYHGKNYPPEMCPSCKVLNTGVLVSTEIFESHLNKFIEIKAMPRFDAEHKVIGVIHIVRDITERKEAEEKLKQTLKDETRSREAMINMLDENNQVREELENNLRKLHALQSQLIHAEKMDAVGRMASGVAHEVKNPLAIILQGIDYLIGVLPQDKNEYRELLQMMKESVKRADHIVHGLLNFSRSSELYIEYGNINSVIESALNLIQYELKLKEVEVIKELKSGLPDVKMDRGKIEQVFINLLDNAIYALPKNGKIYVRSYLLELKEPTDKVGNRKTDIFKLGEKIIVAEVEDTGAGIDESIMNKIFDPFFTTKDRTEGTGLGLSVSKSIIELHGGTINAESQKGKGAKFIIRLKLAEEA